MKKCLLYALLPLVLVLTQIGCSDGTVGDDFADLHYSPKGTLVTTSAADGCFLTDPSISTVTLDLVSDGEAATGADVLVSYNGSAEKLFTTAGSVPSQVSLDMPDVLSLLGIATADVAPGDVITVAFDGKSASGTSRSSDVFNFNIGCPSNLAGTYDYLSTNLAAANSAGCDGMPVSGQVTFTDLGCGVYACDDLGFGQYGSPCWSDSPASNGGAAFTDVCGGISSYGQDQYGLTYTWTITDVSGADLSISWSNDYGDSGDVVITRPDGSDWPALSTN